MATMHNRVTIGGPLYTSERWACSFHFGLGATDLSAFSDLTAAATQIGTALAALDTSSPTNTVFLLKTAGAALTQVSVAALVDGHVVNTGAATINPPGGGSGNLPPQTALVTSLLTDVNTGSGRGRVFMPALYGIQCINGMWTGSASAWLTSFGAILNIMSEKLAAVASADLAVFAASVYSTKLNQLNLVKRLRVNNVFDTQRRRTWSLPATGTTGSYVVA